jgi:ribosomal-protein-alanine N-acetyltransferase
VESRVGARCAEERASGDNHPYAEAVSALPFPEPPLTDGVVMLRPWRDEDAAVKAAWGQDAVIVRCTGVPANYTAEAARARAAQTEEARRAGRTLALAITDASSGVVLGSCDIRRPDAEDPTLGEVGYLLSEAARGRGVATRAMGLLLDWSFRELGMQRVQALVHPENPASAAVLDRLGFKREDLLRRYRGHDDGRGDRVLYAVSPGELVVPGKTTTA